MSSQYEKRILRVLGYIDDHLEEDLSLDRLSDIAAMSRFHWHRIFRAMTGETCAEAVRRLRLERSAHWLVNEDWPVADIACRVGYGKVNSFTRAFKKNYRVSPAEYRRRGQHIPQTKPVFQGEFYMFDVVIKTEPRRRLAGFPHKGAYQTIGASFKKLANKATELNLWGHVKGSAGVYMDNPQVVDEAQLRSFAGLIINNDMEIPEGFEEFDLTGGEHAVLRYRGPYEKIEKAYDYLYGQWLPESGKQPADRPGYELYLNNPEDTPPEDLLTDICLPLAP